MKKILSVLIFLLLSTSSLEAASYSGYTTDAITTSATTYEPAPNAVRNIQTGPDGYTFLVKEFDNKILKVYVHIYPDRESLRKAAEHIGLKANTLAFTQYQKVNGVEHCNMHIVDPTYSYEPEIVGHEFLHCVYGQWHIKNR